MAAFAALALLTFKTIEDPRMRLMTMVVIGLFAVKTALRRKDAMHP